jgi:hypothetical protein
MKWLGHEVEEGGGVLFADFELDPQEQRRRVNQLMRAEGLERLPDSFRYMSALGYTVEEAFRVALEECKKYDVKLMILDSLGPAFEGDTESGRDVIGFYQKRLEPFRAIGVTVLIIDHQSRLRGGESYQGKSAFGSVYKTNLARSVIQVEVDERGEGTLSLKLRQKKYNFGPLADPFGAMLTFTEPMVFVDARELDDADLAEEQTLSPAKRIKLVLEDGPAYPEDISEATGIPLKTVQNNLTKLRKKGEVEPTGEKEGRSEQVRLSVPDPGPPKGSGTRDTEEEGPQGRLDAEL